MLRRMVPIAKLVHENCDSIALGTKIGNILREFEELEEWEDRLKEYLGNEIIRAEGYWKGVLQRVLDIVLRIDNIQDRQIETILHDAFTIATINRFSNEVLKPFDIQTERKIHQMQLWVA
ncbi:hypothetical protein [Mesotoga sp.]|uniref:hypothetical protein n=1 Tax=Mesotoga sp. TaxID=2053577 RepID=UPI00345E680C